MCSACPSSSHNDEAHQRGSYLRPDQQMPQERPFPVACDPWTMYPALPADYQHPGVLRGGFHSQILVPGFHGQGTNNSNAYVKNPQYAENAFQSFGYQPVCPVPTSQIHYSHRSRPLKEQDQVRYSFGPSASSRVDNSEQDAPLASANNRWEYTESQPTTGSQASHITSEGAQPLLRSNCSSHNTTNGGQNLRGTDPLTTKRSKSSRINANLGDPYLPQLGTSQLDSSQNDPSSVVFKWVSSKSQKRRNPNRGNNTGPESYRCLAMGCDWSIVCKKGTYLRHVKEHHLPVKLWICPRLECQNKPKPAVFTRPKFFKNHCQGKKAVQSHHHIDHDRLNEHCYRVVYGPRANYCPFPGCPASLSKPRDMAAHLALHWLEQHSHNAAQRGDLKRIDHLYWLPNETNGWQMELWSCGRVESESEDSCSGTGSSQNNSGRSTPNVDGSRSILNSSWSDIPNAGESSTDSYFPPSEFGQDPLDINIQFPKESALGYKSYQFPPQQALNCVGGWQQQNHRNPQDGSSHYATQYSTSTLMPHDTSVQQTHAAQNTSLGDYPGNPPVMLKRWASQHPNAEPFTSRAQYPTSQSNPYGNYQYQNNFVQNLPPERTYPP